MRQTPPPGEGPRPRLAWLGAPRSARRAPPRSRGAAAPAASLHDLRQLVPGGVLAAGDRVLGLREPLEAGLVIEQRERLDQRLVVLDGEDDGDRRTGVTTAGGGLCGPPCRRG